MPIMFLYEEIGTVCNYVSSIDYDTRIQANQSML